MTIHSGSFFVLLLWPRKTCHFYFFRHFENIEIPIGETSQISWTDFFSAVILSLVRNCHALQLFNSFSGNPRRFITLLPAIIITSPLLLYLLCCVSFWQPRKLYWFFLIIQHVRSSGAANLIPSCWRHANDMNLPGCFAGRQLQWLRINQVIKHSYFAGQTTGYNTAVTSVNEEYHFQISITSKIR